MGGKLSPLIIILLIGILVAVGFFGIKALTAEDTNTSNKNVVEEFEAAEPIITLNKEVDPENEEIVNITIYATIDTETTDFVKEIILPDETTFVGETTTYKVTENGVYSFKVITENGGEATSEIEVTEIAEISASNPYIPEGFEVLEDDVSKGFTIGDSYGNEYVWIPVENGKLTRTTMLNSKYEESSSTASALVNSVAQYYGFYMGRYEASQFEKDGEITVGTMNGKDPWTNITFLNAAEHSENVARMFGYTDCKTALINGYAWDTTMAWIDQSVVNYSSSINYGNYSGTIYPTGQTESDVVNNICDLAGNVREWTTEIYKPTPSKNKNNKNNKDKNEEDAAIQRIVRAGSANLNKTPASRIYYPENTSDNYWGFRTILYK